MEASCLQEFYVGAKSFTDCTAHLSPVRKVHIDTHNFFCFGRESVYVGCSEVKF